MQLNDHGLYDIYEMCYVPLWQRPHFFWSILLIFGCLFLLLFIFLVRLFLKKRNVITPWENALLQIDIINQRIDHDNMSYDDIKKSYFGVTSTLKWYMAQRYNWIAQHLTDNELLLIIERSELSSDIKQNIKILYDNAIMVKFADKKTMVTTLKNDIIYARAIINATIPTNKDLAKQQ